MQFDNIRTDDPADVAQISTAITIDSQIADIVNRSKGTNDTTRCRGCKEEIDPDRLKFIPKCNFCLPCQKQNEAGVRNYQGEEMVYMAGVEDEEEEDDEEVVPKPARIIFKKAPYLHQTEFRQMYPEES